MSFKIFGKFVFKCGDLLLKMSSTALVSRTALFDEKKTGWTVEQIEDSYIIVESGDGFRLEVESKVALRCNAIKKKIEDMGRWMR